MCFIELPNELNDIESSGLAPSFKRYHNVSVEIPP